MHMFFIEWNNFSWQVNIEWQGNSLAADPTIASCRSSSGMIWFGNHFFGSSKNAFSFSRFSPLGSDSEFDFYVGCCYNDDIDKYGSSISNIESIVLRRGMSQAALDQYRIFLTYFASPQ